MGTLHCTLENGADLYVNENQKIRHYRARSTEERRRRRIRRRRRRRRMPNRDFFTSRGAHVNCSVVIHSIPLEISHRTRWSCLKCVIVYLARDIPAFVMYCVYGESRSSLLIESTNSMIRLYDIYREDFALQYDKCGAR